MTFIVRQLTTNSSLDQHYDIVEGANHASISDTGGLVLFESRQSGRVVAVYAAEQWISAALDGSTKLTNGENVVVELSTDKITNSAS